MSGSPSQEGLIKGGRRFNHGRGVGRRRRGRRGGWREWKEPKGVGGGGGGRCEGGDHALRLDGGCFFGGKGLAPIASANPHQAYFRFDAP